MERAYDLRLHLSQTLYEANAGHVSPKWTELTDDEMEPYYTMALAALDKFSITPLAK